MGILLGKVTRATSRQIFNNVTSAVFFVLSLMKFVTVIKVISEKLVNREKEKNKIEFYH